jgi:hypothetical protein
VNAVFRRFAASLVLALLATDAYAQAPAIDVKIGLWELTATTNIDMHMPAVDTSKMTPAVGALAEAMTGSHSSVNKACVTKDRLATSVFGIVEDYGMTCKQTLTTNARTTVEGTAICAGDRSMTGILYRSMTGIFHIDAPSSTSMNGRITMSNIEPGSGTTVVIVIDGTFLAADCGNVK